MNWLKKLLAKMRCSPQASAPVPTRVEQNSYRQNDYLYRSEELTEAELKLLPLLFMESHILDELNGIDYLSGKQYAWLDDLLYAHREQKNVYVSRKAFHLLLRIASGEFNDPLRADLSELRPTVPGWTSNTEKAFLAELDHAVASTAGAGRKTVLATIRDVFLRHGLPVEMIAQRLNRQTEISVPSILVLFDVELRRCAPLAMALRDMELEINSHRHRGCFS